MSLPAFNSLKYFRSRTAPGKAPARFPDQYIHPLTGPSLDPSTRLMISRRPSSEILNCKAVTSFSPDYALRGKGDGFLLFLQLRQPSIISRFPPSPGCLPGSFENAPGILFVQGKESGINKNSGCYGQTYLEQQAGEALDPCSQRPVYRVAGYGHDPGRDQDDQGKFEKPASRRQGIFLLEIPGAGPGRSDWPGISQGQAEVAGDSG